MDFKNVAVSSVTTTTISSTTITRTTVSALSSLGRESSCSKPLLPYAGLEYSEVVITGNVIEFLATQGDCAKVLYKF